jgi:hypothetical protein
VDETSKFDGSQHKKESIFRGISRFAAALERDIQKALDKCLDCNKSNKWSWKV